MGRTIWRCDQSKWPFGKGQPFCDNTAKEIETQADDALKTINTGSTEKAPGAAAFVSEDPAEDKLGDVPSPWADFKGPAATPPYPGNTNSKQSDPYHAGHSSSATDVMPPGYIV